MRQMTGDNLRNAFAGESQAHMKYLIFADRADKEGKRNVAKLFRAIAFAERIHATNHLKYLGSIKDTLENLQTAINGETYEVEEMHPSYYEVAKLQEEKNAQKGIKWALDAERVHAEMYKEAKEAVENGQDVNIGPIYICDVCGYTVEGEIPEECPLCGVGRDKFSKF